MTAGGVPLQGRSQTEFENESINNRGEILKCL